MRSGSTIVLVLGALLTFVQPSASSGSCSNVCKHPADNICDDGGWGSDYGACDFGTDCADCGPRPLSVPDNAVCVGEYDGQNTCPSGCARIISAELCESAVTKALSTSVISCMRISTYLAR